MIDVPTGMILSRCKRILFFCERSKALLLAWLMAALLSGCERSPFNQSERAVDQAEQKQAAGDYKGAVNSYEKALDGTPKTAETHFRLALLYDEKLKDPISAVHHLHRYLAIVPGGAHAREAKTNLNRLELNLATSLSGGTLISHSEAVRLRNDNADLRKQLAAARNPPAALSPGGAKPGVDAGKIAARDAQKNLPPGARTYQVQPGDTLASISRKFYKTKVRAKDIQDANLNAVPDATKLKTGQTLIIP
jgi:nucleoid-associated protein YgaU